MLTSKERELLSALEPHADAAGVEIVTVEVVGARKAPTIRVYIDTPNGVGFDELSAAQAWIGEVFDELDPFPGAYTMEVSSPGIDRPLRTAAHFDRFAGERVRVVSTRPVEGRAKFVGTLRGMDGEDVLVECDGEPFRIPLASVKKAHIVGEVDFSMQGKE